MTSKGYIKVFAIRFLIVNLVYFLVKLTIDHDDNGTTFDATGIFYYISAFFLLMLAWEVNDWLIRRELNTTIGKTLDISNGFKILGINLIIILPIAAALYYLAIFEFENLCKIDADDPWLRFRIDFFRAFVLGFAAILFNMFYFALKQKKELENNVNKLKKEVMTSKYKSLKNQISPHFLFNSLNTLTSLMYEDRDLASDFTSRLASCYRYILDNREQDLVRLDKELSFLDSFIFMMDVRHKMSLKINSNITLDATRYVIPTLSLQMLVENALKHNYYSTEKPLLITISNTNKEILVENTLRVRTDNETSTRLGLENIKKRFSYYTNKPVVIKKDNNVFSVFLPLLQSNVKQQTPLQIV